MKSITAKIILLVSLVFAAQTYAEEKSELPINPNNQVVRFNHVATKNGCFIDKDVVAILSVDGEEKIIVHKKDVEKIKKALYSAKVYNKILNIKSSSEKKFIGSMGFMNECVDNFHRVSGFSTESLEDNKEKELEARLAQCQETVALFATNINSSTGEANGLAGNVEQVMSHASSGSQQ